MSLEFEDRLNYCSQCKNRGFDKNIGLICNLTNEVPSFELKCPNYNPEEEFANAIVEKKLINTEQKFNLMSHLNFIFFFKVFSFFYFTLTLINLILLFFKNYDRIDVGFGLTEILFVLSTNIMNKNLALLLIILFPITGFVFTFMINYKRKNWLIAMSIIVLLDSFIFLHFYNGIQLTTHIVFILILLYTYYLFHKIHHLNSLKNKDLSDHFIQ